MSDDLARLVLLRRVEEFLYREARLLDERRFEDWLDLFAEDGVYWVPLEPGQESPLDTASIIYEDRRMLEVRLTRLRHPKNYADTPPARTRHLVNNVMLDGADDATGELNVGSALLMVEYRDDTQRVFGAGVQHRLRPDGEGFRIASKRVDLVNCDAGHGFMSIPF